MDELTLILIAYGIVVAASLGIVIYNCLTRDCY